MAHAQTTETAQQPGVWFRSTEMPESPRMLRWLENGTISEFFATDAVLAAVVPEFVLNGGTADLIERWGRNQVTDQEIELVMLLMSRTPAEKVRALSGDTAPEYNNGPRWIIDVTNPSIANWWDGESFTGERELVTVLRQRAFDQEAGTVETVSTIAPPEGAYPGLWQTDPQNDTDLIRWGGLRWDQRISMEEMLKRMFAAVNEEVPAEWRGRQSITEHHYALMEQLAERAEGVDGWYKEPSHFHDLMVRYWAQGAWTEHTSFQQAGWYDDPLDVELIRYWNGQQWTASTRNKEAERIREQKSQARKAFVGQLVLNAIDEYKKLNTPEAIRQQKLDAANAHSRALRNEAAIEQERFYRDRQIPWYRKR